MALTEDQAALLRLLLAGDTYVQVADVLGTSPDQVRQRAHEAAAALERDPAGDFPREAVSERLAALDGAAKPANAPPTTTAAADDAVRRRVLWLAGITAVVVVAAVLIVLVASGGDGDEPSSTLPPDREDIVPVRMSPVGGSRAGGTIAIVRAGDQPAVDLALRGLEPSGPGEAYVLWFVGSGGRSLPVAFQAVGRDGRLTGRTPVPTAASGLLPSFDTADLTLTRQQAAASAVQRAAQSGTLPQPVGTTVLRGALR